MTTLTMKDEERIEVIQRVFRGELRVIKAAMMVGARQHATAIYRFIIGSHLSLPRCARDF
jgi:hypothetical protein